MVRKLIGGTFEHVLNKVSSLQGISDLQLETLDVAHTDISTDTLVELMRMPNLTQLSIANTEFVDGDLALEFLAGEHWAYALVYKFSHGCA